MNPPLVCMTLTGKTLEEDLQLVRKYEKYIDIVELRADFLNEDEQLNIRRFPSLIYQPCILTIRRDIDGGLFTSGEFSRTNLFARALAFANQDKNKNFAYVDFEDDYHIPSIQDAALAFGVRIIRSYANINGPITNLREKCDSMRKTGYEIPRVSFVPKKLSDVTRIIEEGKNMTQYDHILTALGVQGFPSRVLAKLSNSFMTYTAPEEMLESVNNYGYVSPVTMNSLYDFRSIDENTALYGITGWPAKKLYGPEIHNSGYKKHGIKAVYIPVRTPIVSEAISFADKVGMDGLSVAYPHKESVLYYLHEQSPDVIQTGSCNCIVKRNQKWIGYNTEVYGFKHALEDFIGSSRMWRRKVAVIGAGETAKAVTFVLRQMGAKVCIFNRSINHAKAIAEKYGFKYCTLEPACAPVLDEYSGLIIQTTSVGADNYEGEQEYNDPIHFYNFHGDEFVFDVICRPAITPLMKRASLAGCRVSNGYRMMEYQSYAQFKLFTGYDFEGNTTIEKKF